MTLEIDEQSQATRHPLRDCHGRPLTVGKYLLSRPGSRTSETIELCEDQLCFDLWFIVSVNGTEVRQRVDELAGDVVLTPVRS